MPLQDRMRQPTCAGRALPPSAAARLCRPDGPLTAARRYAPTARSWWPGPNATAPISPRVYACSWSLPFGSSLSSLAFFACAKKTSAAHAHRPARFRRRCRSSVRGPAAQGTLMAQHRLHHRCSADDVRVLSPAKQMAKKACRAMSRPAWQPCIL